MKSANAKKGGKKEKQGKQNKNKGGPGKSAAGAYAAISTTSTVRGASISSRADGSILVRHREYIAPVSSAIAFTVLSYEVNPGMPGTFPWLSHIARNYETYAFKRLKFEVSPCCPTSKDGAIMSYFDLDAADLAPVSRADLMQNANATISAPWISQSILVPEQALQRSGTRYVRGYALGANLDVKTYDLGCIHVCAEGSTAATIVGDLFVEYEVLLTTPQFNIHAENMRMESTVVAPTKAAPMGTSFTPDGKLPVERATGTAFTFKEAGDYLLETIQSGTVLTATPPGLTDPVNGSTITLVSWLVTAAATSAIGIWKMRVPKPATSLVMDYTNSCTTLTNLVLRFANYAYA